MAPKTQISLPAIPDISEQGLGPAMLALSPMQRKFVLAMVEFGGSNKRCAIAAGYSDPGTNAIDVQAYALAHNPKVQEAIREVGQKTLGGGVIAAAKFLLDTIENPQAEMKDRLKATEMILNRTGLHATSEHKVAVTHKDETSEEMIKQIELMSKRLGIDAQKLLGGIVTDADFTDVTDSDDISDIL